MAKDWSNFRSTLEDAQDSISEMLTQINRSLDSQDQRNAEARELLNECLQAFNEIKNTKLRAGNALDTYAIAHRIDRFLLKKGC